MIFLRTATYTDSLYGFKSPKECLLKKEFCKDKKGEICSNLVIRSEEYFDNEINSCLHDHEYYCKEEELK
jgi:hypothetical protein